MPAGDVTQGRRRPDGTEHHEMQPGDYAKTTGGKTWYLVAPERDSAGEMQFGAVNPDIWELMEEADGKLTVNPSIWFSKPEGWHGFLKHGVWSQV